MPPWPSRVNGPTSSVGKGVRTWRHRDPFQCSKSAPGKMPMPLPRLEATHTLFRLSATTFGLTIDTPVPSRRRGNRTDRQDVPFQFAIASTGLADAGVTGPTAQMSRGPSALVPSGTTGMVTLRQPLPLYRSARRRNLGRMTMPNAQALDGLKTAAEVTADQFTNLVVVHRPWFQCSASVKSLTPPLVPANTHASAAESASTTALSTPVGTRPAVPGSMCHALPFQRSASNGDGPIPLPTMPAAQPSFAPVAETDMTSDSPPGAPTVWTIRQPGTVAA